MAKMYTVVSPGGEETVSLKTGEAVCKKEYSEQEAEALLQQVALWELVRHIHEAHDHEEYGETASEKEVLCPIEADNILICDGEAIGCVVEDMALLFKNAGEKVKFEPYSYDSSRIHRVYATGYLTVRQVAGYGSDWSWEPETATVTVLRELQSVPQFFARRAKKLMVEAGADMEKIKELSGFVCLACVEIRGDLHTIPESAFCNCASLKSVILPQSVTTVGRKAFYRCKSLEKISLPNVLEIREQAFEGCSQLKEVNGLDKLKSLGAYAFNGCESLESFCIGPELGEFHISAFRMCKALRAFAVDGANRAYSQEDGILYSKDQSKLILYPCAAAVQEYTVPAGVSRLDPGAFDSCRFVRRIVLHRQITELPASCFAYCGALEKVILPEALEVLPQKAFEGCGALTEIDLPGSLKQIQERAFANCTALREIDIPESVERIGKEAFHYCRELRRITVRNGKCRLEGMIQGCYSPLTVKHPACAEFVDSIGGAAHNYKLELLDGVSFQDVFGSVIEGHFDEKLDGTGICRFKKGDYGIKRRYVGEFKNGKINGQGVFTLTVYGKPKYEYTGQFADGLYHGNGRIRYKDDAVIAGEFRNDKPWNAEGTYKTNCDKALSECCESVYVGKWVQGKFTGHGIERDRRGNQWEGSWVDGEKEKTADA